MRREAAWMALHLSVQSGKQVTPAQLLGEEPTEADAVEAAEARLAKLREKYEGAV